MSSIYLVEYKMVLVGGVVREGVETTSADSELQAQQRAEDSLRTIDRRAEIVIGDAVAV